MKSPLRKLRDFALQKHGSKEKSPALCFEAAEEPEEVRIGMQDVEDMQTQYDGLLSVAHSISGSAYDFSRSIQEMASYMVDTFGKIGDGETGNIFSMLGKVEYEISKLLDLYAAHVSQTIIIPTETLLKELQSVEDIKRQYDEKRQLYNQIRTQKPKGKVKKENVDVFDQQLLTIKEELNDLAMLLGLRFQSLKHGRQLSLITQAARHHTAQVHLFRKGLDSLNAVEPVMKQLSQDHNIDRTLCEGDVGIHDNEDDVEMDGDAPENGDEEESLDGTPRSLQPVEIQKSAQKLKATGGATRKWEGSSKSAPISPAMYFGADGLESIREFSLDKPAQKAVTTYALPSPAGTSGRWSNQATGLATSQSQTTGQGLWTSAVSLKSELHSSDRSEVSQVETGVHASPSGTHELKGPIGQGNSGTDMWKDTLRLHSAEEKNQVLKQDQNLRTHTQLTTSAKLNASFDVANNGDASNLPMVRYSHSGPLAAKPWTGYKQTTVNSGVPPIISHQADPLYKSGPVSRSAVSRAFVSPRISPSVSPPHLSPPRISELHKLPTPPPKSPSLIAHSAPFGKKNPERSLKIGPASPLPPPPLGVVTRSRSIPSSGIFSKKLQHTKVMDPQILRGAPLSPPLKPILLQETPSSFHAPTDEKRMHQGNHSSEAQLD